MKQIQEEVRWNHFRCGWYSRMGRFWTKYTLFENEDLGYPELGEPIHKRLLRW